MSSYKTLVRKPVEFRQLERARQKCKDNINLNLMETECVTVHWIHLAWEGVQWQAQFHETGNFWTS